MTAGIGDGQTGVPGVLMVLHDVAAGADEEFNRWYQEQHVSERMAVKGFRTARRYRAVGSGPAYMAVYECDSIDVLASKAYRDRLANPTDWTRRVMPDFRNMLRSACRQTWSAGTGFGGGAIVVRCKPEPGREDIARNFINATLTPDLMQRSALVRMALWEADASFTGGTSPEMALRGGVDKSVDWVLFLESYDLARSASAMAAGALAASAGEAGLSLHSWNEYRLMHARWRDG